MTSLPSFTFPSLPALGPAALLAAAVATAILLTRPARARIPIGPVVPRRLGVPNGVVRWLVIGALTVAALLALGIDLHGLWSTAVTVLSLVAIGFVAMWSLLSHVLASVLIVIFRPFEVGDRVELIGDDPVLGEVTDLNPVYTTLRTEDGAVLQIPNNLFFQKVLKRHVPAALACARPSPV